MSDAYQCDKCGEFSTGQPAGSITLNIEYKTRSMARVNIGSHSKDDLCAECALEVHQKVFGEDED